MIIINRQDTKAPLLTMFKRKKKQAELVSKSHCLVPLENTQLPCCVTSALRAHIVLAKWHSGLPLPKSITGENRGLLLDTEERKVVTCINLSCITRLSYFGLLHTLSVAWPVILTVIYLCKEFVQSNKLVLVLKLRELFRSNS